MTFEYCTILEYSEDWWTTFLNSPMLMQRGLYGIRWGILQSGGIPKVIYSLAPVKAQASSTGLLRSAPARSLVPVGVDSCWWMGLLKKGIGYCELDCCWSAPPLSAFPLPLCCLENPLPAPAHIGSGTCRTVQAFPPVLPVCTFWHVYSSPCWWPLAPPAPRRNTIVPKYFYHKT